MRARRLCAGRARGSRRRSPGDGADRGHAQCPRRTLEGVFETARNGGQICCRPRTVPALDADPGCWAGCGAELCDRDRRSLPVKRSRDVAAYFGLTSRRWQSGKSIDVQGRISKAGDPDVRRALYEAASALLTRFKRKDKIKTWGLAIVLALEPRQQRGCRLI